MGLSDSPPPVPPGCGSPSPGGTACGTPRSLPRLGVPPGPRTWIFGQPGPSPASSSAEMAGPPRFLEGPLSVCRALRPRPGPRARPLRRSGAAAPLCDENSPSKNSSFEAPSRGLRPRCLRFAGALAVPPTQDSLLAGGRPLPGGALTRWIPYGRFPASVGLCLHLPSPFPRLRLAHCIFRFDYSYCPVAVSGAVFRERGRLAVPVASALPAVKHFSVAC
jgi:hypothetical protein